MTEEIKDGTTEVIETISDDDKAKAETNAKTKAEADAKTKEDADAKAKKGALSDVDKKAAEKTQAVQSVLDEYDIDSLEQLTEFLKNLSGLKDRLGKDDLEELKENSVLLKKYQKHWAKEEAAKKEDGETPEETIKRLKEDNRRIDRELRDDREKRDNAIESDRDLKTFNSTVTSSVEANKDLPTEYHPFLKEFLGVDNEINEVDLNDKAGVKRIAKAGAKKLLEFEQLAIKRYLKGKAKVPDITTAAETASDKPVKITRKNVKAMMVERIKAAMK